MTAFRDSTRRPSFRPNFRAQARRGTSEYKPRDRTNFDYPDNWAELSLQARQRAGWRCQYHMIADGEVCSAYFPPPYHGKLHTHHHTAPVRKGGKSRPADLVVLCSYHHAVLHPHMQGANFNKKGGRRKHPL